jgi:apolipoprotein N-acyltransferase
MFPAMNERVESLPESPRWRPSLPTVACLLAGVMLTTAMPPLRGTAPLAPLALAVLFHVLRGSRHPGRSAFWFAVAHTTTLLVWLFSLDPAKSIPTRALVPVQAIATILFVSAHYGLMGLLAGWIGRRTGPRFLLAALPVLWMGTELLRTVGELGFPWCLTGAAWLDTPLRPLYAASGELGLGAATALTAATVVAVVDFFRDVDPPRAVRLGLVTVTAATWLGLVVLSRPTGPPPLPAGARSEALLVACVQADVSQADKWDDAKIDSTRIPYARLTAEAAAAGAELVVWAETAVPAYLRYDRELLAWVRATAREHGVPILTGFPDAEPIEGSGRDGTPRRFHKYNAAGLFSAEGTLIERYAKHHLLPIGETMPFQRWLPFLGRIDVGQAEWLPGAAPAPMPLPTPRGEVGLITMICYEAVFGELARQAVREGGQVLVNITNDGWFGLAAGPRQHAALARIRAVECGVPLLRSANNGISMICDARGEVLARLPLHRRGAVVAAIDPVPRGTWYLRLGPWPPLLLLLAWLPVAWLLARRDRARDEHPEEETR